MKYSFGILKPDCLRRNLSVKVLNIIEQHGLTVVSTKKLQIKESDVAVVYENCLEKDFWHGLVESYSAGESIVFIVYGENAIDKLNELVGFCEPQKAEKNTLRHRFGSDIRYNIIHSTENLQSLRKEVSHFFSTTEQEKIFRVRDQ